MCLVLKTRVGFTFHFILEWRDLLNETASAAPVPISVVFWTDQVLSDDIIRLRRPTALLITVEKINNLML